MTVQELFQVLKSAIHDGYGNAEILFDTEAREFDYHTAKIGRAYLECEVDPEHPFVWLGEI